MRNSYDDRGFPWFGLLIAGVAAVVIIGLSLLFGLFGYVAHSVQPNEVALQLNKQEPYALVGSGVYTKLGIFQDIVDIRTEGLRFESEDAEVLTLDQQRIGLRVTGTVHRPGLEIGLDQFANFWKTYRSIYEDDSALIGTFNEQGQLTRAGLIQQLAQQAMKVCVGERTFAQAAVGQARDALGQCIQEELATSAGNYGLVARNVVVPEIIIGQEVQAKLDEITQAKFATDLARQQQQLAVAEAERRLAEEQGRIRVEQGVVQETQTQRTITAGLERAAIEAEQQVIEAEKANELRQAELNVAVTEKELEAARLQAQITLADQTALADLYFGNPAYVDLLVQQAWAAAYNETDKVIIPAGMNPYTVLSPEGTGLTTIVDPSATTSGE